MSATPWTMEQMTPDPTIRVGDTDTETLHLLPLRADELAHLRMLCNQQSAVLEDGAAGRLFAKVRALALIAELVQP